ncbi:MAG: hypothetical protein IH611_08110 [Deltaproteobacteria bacterium]|nr:hypothetical protein [Deltaproteobacteria bacterium]
MKRKGLLISVAGAALLLSLFLSKYGNALKYVPSSATEVSIDGRTFRSADFLADEATLVRRELEKPDASGKEPSAGLPDIPRGLTTEHTLRMSGGGRSVELAFGKTETRAAGMAYRLANGGWTPVSSEGNPRFPRMLHKIRGKEVTVVCLDEKEDGFLLIRRVEP